MKTLILLGLLALPALSLAQSDDGLEPGLFRLNPGPWGELEAQTLQLTPDRGWIEKNQDLEAEGETVWDFVAPSEAKLRALLGEVGFEAAAVQQLLASERTKIGPETNQGRHYAIRPTPEMIESLTPANRSDLYNFIRASGANSHFLHSATIENDDALAWFNHFGVSKSVAELAAGLCYNRGRSIAFSDHIYVLSGVADREEKINFYQAIHQTSALSLRLRLTPESDVEALSRYWSEPGKTESAQAKLRSLVPRTGERWLDIAHLFPRTLGSRLNTFRTNFDVNSSQPDCRWTALNFFAEITSERHADVDENFDQILAEFYEPTLPPFRFGDVIAIRDQESGILAHTCVYVADDVVFTKNGRGASRPWILQRDSHLSRIYVMERPVRMAGFRLKRRS
ncbi:MAG: hypothetical protein ACI8UO_003089 [Verrucomicrobiales bacterium]|jgi:hypothetical protein